MESDMAAYKSDFLQEIYECLDTFNQSFVDLENGDAAAIDEIFRITHTIKGMAGFLGYASLEHLCHNMEEVLCGIKNGDIEIDGELVDILLSTVDRITDIVKQIESADNDNVKIEDLLEAFETYEKIKGGGQELPCARPEKNKVLLPGILPPAISAQQPEENTSSKSECRNEKANEKSYNPNECNLNECSLNECSLNECNLDGCNPNDCNLDNCSQDSCNKDTQNLVLEITLSRDCVMKDLRALLIIESLKDISKLIKTDPDESEMDSSFDGHFKVFLLGESNKVEELMDRISEIEQFNISETKSFISGIRPFNSSCNNNGAACCDSDALYSNNDALCSNNDAYHSISTACDNEIKYNSTISEKSLSVSLSTSAVTSEVTAFSASNRQEEFHSRISSLIARLRCILTRISKSINCFKITESAGIFPGKECKDSSNERSEVQKVQVLEKEIRSLENEIQNLENESRILEKGSQNLEINSENLENNSEIKYIISDQELRLNEELRLNGIQASENTLGKTFDMNDVNKRISDPEFSNPELQFGPAQALKEDHKHIRNQRLQGLQPDRAHETGESDSIAHFSESAVPSKGFSETKRQETIRVRTSNLDNIMNLVGELVINKGRLLQISQEYNLPELEEATGTLDKSISSLQDEVMRIRMVKIERVFSKFPRMVRDLSRKFNKNIEFEIEGQDTELDRTILDEISDPLVHLVRNAVDHGIEYPEERAKTGKKEAGHIKLSARREKNNVIIEIEDDGKGIDIEILKKKAVEKGLLSAFDVENLSEEEIRMIIFAPGFSTKDTPTEISGRGVGMDAVKTAVEKLGGKIRVYSKKGEFTRIRIDLPPTVAIIKSLLVEVGPETYAIPISNVVKALSVNSSDYKLVKETPLLYIGDKLIPVIELKEIFNVECEKPDKELAIVVEKENEEVGLIVDSIIDQQEIVIKPLGTILSHSKGFIGATILGDGRVIPIIDVSTLIRGDIDD